MVIRIEIEIVIEMEMAEVLLATSGLIFVLTAEINSIEFFFSIFLLQK